MVIQTGLFSETYELPPDMEALVSEKRREPVDTN